MPSWPRQPICFQYHSCPPTSRIVKGGFTALSKSRKTVNRLWRIQLMIRLTLLSRNTDGRAQDPSPDKLDIELLPFKSETRATKGPPCPQAQPLFFSHCGASSVNFQGLRRFCSIEVAPQRHTTRRPVASVPCFLFQAGVSISRRGVAPMPGASFPEGAPSHCFPGPEAKSTK